MSDPKSQYLAWKKNSQHLYDTLFAFDLPWPSLSVCWVPELISRTSSVPKTSGSPLTSTKQRLVLTTHTSYQADEYVRLVELTTPTVAPPESLGDLDAKTGTLGGYHPAYTSDLHISQRIFVKGIVQLARLMPQNPNIVSTLADNGDCAVFDITKFPSRPVQVYQPTMKLKGHSQVADPISQCWSPTQEGLLAIGYSHGDVEMYDIKRDYNYRTGTMQPVKFYSHEQGKPVNDIHWHPRRPDILASCGDDGWVLVRDASTTQGSDIVRLFVATKQNDETPPTLVKLPTALAWNPVNESLLAVGFDNGELELWDIRQEPVRLFSFSGHKDYITRIVWNTWHPSLLATASVDQTTKIWNAARFTADPIFTHGGHRAPVTDVQWNPAVPRMLASVSEDNGFHVYAPSDDLLD